MTASLIPGRLEDQPPLLTYQGNICAKPSVRNTMNFNAQSRGMIREPKVPTADSTAKVAPFMLSRSLL
jgi:hypothetical protein